MMQLNSKDKKVFFDDIIKDGILDLSNIELEKLPDDIGIFSSQIKALNLSYNNFSEFPLAGLLSLKNLNELNFLNKEVWHYPDEISEIENLKKLQVNLSFESRASAKLLSALKMKGVKIVLASK
jgi:Leucine-rich repeat (LRR) protein